MKTAALLLIIGGGALPLLGVAWAYEIGKRRLATLDRAESIRDLVERRVEQGLPELNLNAMLRSEGIPATTWNDIAIMQALVVRSIVRENVRALLGPAVLGLFGIVAGTAGGALALYAV